MSQGINMELGINDDYTISSTPYGKVITSTTGIPVSDYDAITKLAGPNPKDLVLSLSLVNYYKYHTGKRVVMVIARSQKDHDEWCDEVEREIDTLVKKGTSKRMAWAIGLDSGLSSMFLMYMLEKRLPSGSITPIYKVCNWRQLEEKDSWPMDAYDFGRCMRMLDLFSELRLNLHEGVFDTKEWKQLAVAWASIEAQARHYGFDKKNEIEKQKQGFSKITKMIEDTVK